MLILINNGKLNHLFAFIFASFIIWGSFSTALFARRKSNKQFFRSGFVPRINLTNIEYFPVSDDTSGADQSDPAISSTSNGSFVVVWKDDRNDDRDIYLQRFNSMRQAQASNLKVNVDVQGRYRIKPAVSYAADGSFVVVWQDGSYIKPDIHFQRYDSSGQPSGDNQQVYYDGTGANRIDPDVSSSSDGSIVIVWTDFRNGNWDIFLQRYNPSGKIHGTNVKVNDDHTNAFQYRPAIAAAVDGSFAVVWEDKRNGDWDIYFQRYNSSGLPQGNNKQVNNAATGVDQQCPDVTFLADGSFVIVWEDRRNGNADIFLQSYDNFGIIQGMNEKVNDDETGLSQSRAAIASTSDGSLIVVWEDYRDGSENPDIYAQKYYADGTKTGQNFRVNNDETLHSQLKPDVTINGNDEIIFAWQDNRLQGQDYDIFARIMDFDTTNTAPAAPALLAPVDGEAISDSLPALSWKVPSDQNGDSLHFKVEISDDANSETGILTFESKNNPAGFSPDPPVPEGQGIITYTLQSRLSESDWWWRVSAWDGKVHGSSSALWKFTINFPPRPPQNLSAISGNQTVKLSWAPNTELDMSHYIVYSSHDSGFTPTPADSIGYVNHPDTAFTHSDLTNGITYYYRISAVDTFGNESDFSEEVSATPSAPNIFVPITQYDFGNVWIESIKSWNLKIKNIGTDTLSILDINWKETVFMLSDTAGFILPGDSLKITVIFKPSTIRSYKDSLKILSNDPDQPNLKIILSGEGIAIPEPDIILSDTSHDFGDVVVDSTESWILTIKNIGTDTLIIHDINWKKDAFALSDTTASIAPDDNILTTVTFRPESSQTYLDTLMILSNDPDESSVKVAFSGQGVSLPVPDIDVSNTEYDFGQVLIDSSKSWELIIKNAGSAGLNISDMIGNQAVFTLDRTSASIQLGDSLIFIVTFTPIAVQLYEDMLTIYSNDPDESAVQVHISGQGIAIQDSTLTTISVLPNPFTPNNDGYNDYVEFKYPEMFDREPVIRIFNLKGRKVCELKEFAGNEYHWYGKDDDGRELEPGVYIYILEANGKRISSGTITLIR